MAGRLPAGLRAECRQCAQGLACLAQRSRTALPGRQRAALFGRAPVGKDVELALVLFGFLGDAPPELVAWRDGLFPAAAHHYHLQRRIVASVPESTLRLTPDEVRTKLPDWRSLVAGA